MAKKATNGLGDRFELARDTVIPRFIGSIEGEVGTGKTYFACSAPAPIFYGDIDLGTNGVIEQFVASGKEIYQKSYEWSAGDTDDNEEEDEDVIRDLQERAAAVRDEWEKDAYYAIKHGAKTLVEDTESRYWQLYRYAEFGSPNAENVRDYDRLNQRFEKLINVCKAKNINLILLRSYKDKWGMTKNKKGKSSFGKGGREPWGYEHLPSMMEVELTFIHRSEKEVAADEEAMGEYVIKFGKCRFNASLQYTVVPRGDFADIGTMMLPETERGDWE